MIAFRGRGAEILLPPTRSLVRAKRSLAGLPGGGGTPLAAGIDAAVLLAQSVARSGGTPLLVLLSDGRANVARSGAAARALRVAGLGALLVDTSPQPQPTAQRLAAEMNAVYLPLPHAGAAVLSAAVQATAAAR
jgi:magnesium chelatase subunit D